MSEENSVDDLVRRNKENKQKIKNRIQNLMKRPHPLNKISKLNNGQKHNSKPLNLDLQHHRAPKYFVDSIIQPSRDLSYCENQTNNIKQKSFEYNSNLFKNIHDSQNAQPTQNKTDQFMNNFSSTSGISKFDSNIHQKSSSYNILDKVDELLADARKSRGKSKQRSYDQFSDRNSSNMTDSAISSSNRDTDFKFNYQLPQSKVNKLKTIQQQKQTLTIDRQQENKKRERIQKYNKKQTSKKYSEQEQIQQQNNFGSKKIKQKNTNLPPLASNLNSTVQRQRKKLQTTMLDFRKTQHHEQCDKQSIAFSLSDSQHQFDNEHAKNNQQNNQQVMMKQNQYNTDLQKKQIQKNNIQDQKNKLLNQKHSLEQELQQINKRLSQIYNFPSEDQA